MELNKCASVFGHSNYEPNMENSKRLENALRDCIENKRITSFYIGGYGKFDICCAIKLHSLKIEYPEIKVILVTSYINNLHLAKVVVDEYFDEILYPSLENVIPKFAIVYRNKWMIDHSDYCIFYVNHSWGNASKMLNYAIRKKCDYVNISIDNRYYI